MIYDNLKHPGMAMAIRVLQKIHFSPFCNSFEKYRDKKNDKNEIKTQVIILYVCFAGYFFAVNLGNRL